ncbi:MAG: secretin and TonB N-terminal domain-containing protein [Myxococcota bacterium]
MSRTHAIGLVLTVGITTLAHTALAGPGTVSMLAHDAITVGPSQRVNLDLKDADVTAVLERLAAIGRVNIVISDEVKGRITLRLRNVSWQEALHAVLRAKGLDMQRDGNVIWVASYKTIEAEKQERLREKWRCTPETKLGPLEFCKNVE